jgi:hypothetical protein
MKQYDIHRAQRLKEFKRCIEQTTQKLRQRYLELNERRLISRLKPFRKAVNSDYFNGSYFVQGVEFKNEVNQLETY